MPQPLRIVWTEAALQDMESILGYIFAHDSLAAAERIHARLLAAVETLTDNPERCRIVPELDKIGISDFRELINRPYRICFRVHGSQVVLVSILDGRRDLEQILLDRALKR
jgi:toxin ParE1/3/4